MRLINADAAFDALDEKIPQDADLSGYVQGLMDAMQYIVNNAPEIDAVPVTHAHWIVRQEFHDAHGAEWEPVFYECSCCGKATEDDSPYCPECGARMDQPEVAEEEKV